MTARAFVITRYDCGNRIATSFPNFLGLAAQVGIRVGEEVQA